MGLLSNDTQVYFSVLSAIEGHLRAGKLKALAVAAPKRLATLPDVPTTAEAGFPELFTGTWWGLMAPKGTDGKIVERLGTEVRTALTNPAVIDRFAQLGMVTGGQTPAEVDARIKKEAASWKYVIDSIGLKPE